MNRVSGLKPGAILLRHFSLPNTPARSYAVLPIS
jgi:hypothetical protein